VASEWNLKTTKMKEKKLEKTKKILQEIKMLYVLGLLIVACFLAGSAHAGTVLIPVKPRDGEKPDYCAETCIQEAMIYFGKSISQVEINRAGGGDKVQGLWSDGIETALRTLGVKHEKWRLNNPKYFDYIETIKQKIDQGFPVLVGVKINPTKHPNWFCDHFILLVGYTDDSFIFNSPTQRKERSFVQFRDGDRDGSGWTLTNPFDHFFGVAIKGMSLR